MTGFNGHHADLDLIPRDAHFKRFLSDFGAWVIHPGSVTDVEFPGVPRTINGPRFNISIHQRGSHVWTDIVNRGVFAIQEKHPNHAVLNVVGSAFSGGDVPHFGHNMKLGHTANSPFGVLWDVFRNAFEVRDAELSHATGFYADRDLVKMVFRLFELADKARVG